MKRLLLSVFAVVIVAMMFIPGIHSVSGATTVTVTGIIRDWDAADGKYVGVDGVHVEIDVGGNIADGYTNAAGEFTIDISDMSQARIRFSLNDVPIFVSMSDFSNGWYSLADYGTFGGVIGVLLITTETGYVEGYVKNDSGQPLGGVRVEFEGQGTRVAVFTNSDGKYQINKLDTGVYTVTAEGSGLKTESMDFVVTKSSEQDRQIVPTIVLTSTSATYIAGLDLEHTLMVVGLILGFIVVSVSVAYTVRMRKHRKN